MAKKLTQAAKLLRKAGRILRDPKKRTVQAFARNASDEPVDATSDEAARFCLLGAIRKVSGGKHAPGYGAACNRTQALLHLPPAVYGDELATAWDDTDTRGRTRIANKLATYTEYE